MMRRSQIYLPIEQWRCLNALSHQVHETMSELIRRAIDKAYGAGRGLDFPTSLQQAAGIWKDRKDLPSTRAYVRELRRGSRLQRLYRKGDARHPA